MSKRLYKNTDDKLIFGVCSGIADYIGIDPVIVRIIFVFLSGTFFIYIILAILIPDKPKSGNYKNFDYDKED